MHQQSLNPYTGASDQDIQTYSDKEYSAVADTVKSSLKMVGFGAVAASGLLACNQIEADIQYSGVQNISVGSGQNAILNLDFAGDTAGANNEVGLFNSGTVNQTARGFVLRREAGADFEFIGVGSSMVYRGGASMGDATANQPFSAGPTGWMGLASQSAVATDPWGVFANEGETQTGILGFRFTGITAGGGTGQLFGWARLQLLYEDTNGNDAPGQGDNLSLTIVDWAYDDEGNGIHFGDISTVPEPGTGGALALLAMGAAGVRRRRHAS